MNVLVWAGAGASPSAVSNLIATLTPLLHPHYAITTVSNSQVFTNDPWQSSTALVVFPGGRDVPYCQSLNGAPNNAIASWVRHRGGKYLGFCAGGYYGSKRCEFEVGDRLLEVCGSRELGFFPGTCRGAAFTGFVYDQEDGAKAAALTVEESLAKIEGEVRVYCNGGGIFVDADSLKGRGIEVLSRFKDKVAVEGGDAAVVYCKVGTGAAILTGIHPEIRASQLNKADGGANYIRLIDALLAADAQRDAFLRALLTKLDLKLSPESASVNGKSTALTPIHVFSSTKERNRALYTEIVGLADESPGGGGVSITDTNDAFSVAYLESPLDSMRDLGGVLEGVAGFRDGEVKRMYFHPCLRTYGYFSIKEYFAHLPPTSSIGQSLAYVEVTTSTQTLLDKNPALLRTLPPGFCITATSQISSRGRAGNAWISPRGALPFSFVLRLPMKLSSRLVFVQYLVSLAVVEAIRKYDVGWEDVDVCIKWPNDVYGKSRFEQRWEKIGGIIVNSTYVDNEYVLVVGIGINTTNPHPTTSLLNIIPPDLQPPTHERLLAKILSLFSDYYTIFLESGFRTFERQYYRRWLHTDQIVAIENGISSGRVVGISCADGGSGGLLVDEVDFSGRNSGRIVEVVADGNSFDMMKGLLRRKNGR